MDIVDLDAGHVGPYRCRKPRFERDCVTVDADDLMAQACAADRAPSKGPLHGLPIAVKDLANLAGLPMSMGSPVFAGKISKTTDIAVQRMLDAGAIVVGKTNTPEFGLDSHTYTPVLWATCNYYDHTRSAGGSSGGAAVGFAAGMISLADTPEC